VKVLGTVFNLKVRQNDREAELDLEQGKVQFSSTKTNENVILVAGNKAILDQSTGNITVVKNQEIENVPAWKRGMLTFREKTLIDVVTTLGTNYNVDIQIKGAVPLDDSFTGNLPVSDLDEALLILQTSYHLKCVKKEKNIVLYRN
jgi:ferric-dicitrate binding protein FerR (iron transport regulator)